MSGLAGAGGAPHGRVFYGFIVFLGLAGAVFFGVASLSGATDAGIRWRIVFALPIVSFLVGMVQAGERLVRPERSLARAARWPAAVRARLFRSRWIVLGVAFCGVGTLTVLRHFVSPEGMDVCDDLRVLCWTLVFPGFCLADVIGERMLDGSRLLERWPAPPSAAPPPRRPRRRRSGLTVRGGSE